MRGSSSQVRWDQGDLSWPHSLKELGDERFGRGLLPVREITVLGPENVARTDFRFVLGADKVPLGLACLGSGL